jgi:hypothetical protein
MSAEMMVRLRGAMVLIQETRLQTSGLVLPEKVSESTREATACHRIVGLGPDAVHKGLSLGERVLIRPQSQKYIVPDSSKRFMVMEDEILGTVVEPDLEQAAEPNTGLVL